VDHSAQKHPFWSRIGQNWRVRILIAIIATIPILVAFTVFDADPTGRVHLFRDLIKDISVVILGLLIVSIVWDLLGGEPVAQDVKHLQESMQSTQASLQESIQSTQARLVALNALTESAHQTGLVRVGTRINDVPFSLTTLAKESKTAVDLCGLAMQLLHYDRILQALEAAAKRGVHVRIVIAAPDNTLLRGSNDEAQFSGMFGLIEATLNYLKPAAERAGSTFVVKVLRQKTILVSLLRCDDRMLITPYLISMTTPESPKLLVEGATTSLFQVYLREFNYLFERAEPAWPTVAAVASLRPAPTPASLNMKQPEDSQQDTPAKSIGSDKT
jgi:hypothetical protein